MSPARPAGAPRRRGARGHAQADFHRQTVLFQWALSKLGVGELKQFKERYQVSPDSAEGIDERTGLHRFFEAIAGVLPTVADANVVPVDRLRVYEQNILEHTQAINTSRMRHNQPRIDWKYHQYLALLFTEMFLDRYFQDAGRCGTRSTGGSPSTTEKRSSPIRSRPSRPSPWVMTMPIPAASWRDWRSGAPPAAARRC